MALGGARHTAASQTACMSARRVGNVFDRVQPLRRLAQPLEVAQIRRFGRSLFSVLFRTPVLLLHTTGRCSGLERTTALAFHEDAVGALVVVGGANGQTRIPDWVRNLQADPEAAVTNRRQRHVVLAEELVGGERARLWPDLVARWPRIEVYERRAGRPVPVFRLTRSVQPVAKARNIG